MNRLLLLGLCTATAVTLASRGFAEQKAGDQKDPVAAIQAYLDTLAAEEKLSGVAVVAKDGKPIASKAAGVANRATGEPIRLDTKFHLGSMNKMFTAVAIAQLAQQGRLKFDDTVGRHLPDYSNKDVAEKVQIHHLLTHSSGLGSFWGEEHDRKRETLLTVSDHLPLFANQSPAFTPGARFEYSNAGFMLLGAIIEKVSGESYHEYVQRHIYDVAGMKETGFYDPQKVTPNSAVGYTKPKGATEEIENTGLRQVRGGPAGGGYSTAGDMLKFHIALRDHKLLDPEHTKLVTTGKVESGGAPGRYGYGFGDKTLHGKRIVGHNGGGPGIAANFDMFTDSGYTAVIFMNRDGLMMPVIFKLRELIPVT